MLHFDKVRKSYGSFLALDIPDFTINGGLTWLKGENGSGKTTLLKMIAGLHPFKGEITLHDQYSLRKNRRQFLQLVSYAEAEPLYPSFLTADDLINFYCHTKNCEKTPVYQLLERLHLKDDYQKPLGAYSSGMMKKLSLALAFTGSPRLILLDEPLITIDSDAITIICDLIQSAMKKDVSFIITSHQAVANNQLPFSQVLTVNDRTILHTN